MTRRGRIIVAVALVAVALALLSAWLSRPSQVAAIITNRVGAALGLEITARGASEYRLRGTPMLVLRDVTVREPEAKQAILVARRMHVSLPWSTLRAAGGDLTAQRIELDAPRLHVPALQRWLATRPPSKRRLPTLTHGLRISDGALLADDWRVDAMHIDLRELAPSRPLQARLRGRYLAAPLTIPFDLAVAIARPGALIEERHTGFATRGKVTFDRDREWRIPATLELSGPLRLHGGSLDIVPARAGIAASYEGSGQHVAFALGVHGPLRFDNATWSAAPVGVALRARGDARTNPVPTLDASGSLAMGRHLTTHLAGRIARWPVAWPALPAPIGQSQSSLPFVLAYDGAPGFTDVASLELQRGATRFVARFQLPKVLEWVDNMDRQSPLPPLVGTLTTPQLDIAGAKLEGVEIEFGDEGAAP